MNVLVMGGSGLIGKAFAQEMLQAGHQLTLLSRRPERVLTPAGARIQGWDGHSTTGWADLVEQADVLVNLVGENIGAGRWTADRKRRILESRLEAGRIATAAVANAIHRPRVMMQASAVGYYGPNLNATLSEAAAAGADYMAQLTVAWEESTLGVEAFGVRRMVIRTGLVLDRSEGILPRFLLPFRFFAGGPMGSGRQGISWIHLRDQVGAMRFLLEQPAAMGIFNLTAPNPVPNAAFGKAISQVLGRPYWLPAPAFALRMLLGEMSTLILDGQLVVPENLVRQGYRFLFPELQPALKDLLG